ncbi:MAG: pyridoxamine 5'-phosphate oxidase family protein [Steroidobacteraceae bacterium]
MSSPLPGRPSEVSPYHAGERAVQRRASVHDRMEQVGRRVIRTFMPDQHRELFAALPFALVGSLDAHYRPWASVLVGHPGFMQSPDPQTLQISTRCVWGDPLAHHLGGGAQLGVLGIQLETRRRNRMNGTIIARTDEGITVHVEQSFGNCPKYIQARQPHFAADQATVGTPRAVRHESSLLSRTAIDLIARADTFFIATASPLAGRVTSDAAEGVDISHRGGKPGFVHVGVQADRTLLTSPDFVGNFFFNTLGNVAANPHAGLLFIDFASGDLLSLTGEASIIWSGPRVDAFAGAQRLLQFRVGEGVAIAEGVPLRWSEPAFAPQLAATGSWAETVNARSVGEYGADAGR